MISTISFLLPWFVYLPKILCMCRRYIFSSQRVPWNVLQRQQEYWSEVLHKDKFFWILISRCISLDFLSTSVALNISSLYLLFLDFDSFMSLFGPYFGCPPIFQKYFALDTTLNTHEQNQVSRSKLIFQIHKQTHSVQYKHNHTPNFRK